jgi:hypothetical protein
MLTFKFIEEKGNFEKKSITFKTKLKKNQAGKESK